MERLSRTSQCQVLLVESIPQNLSYSTDSPRHASTYFAWNLLLSQANRSISIASFYWSLLAESNFNETGAEEGRHIYEQLLEKSKNLNLTIAQSGPVRNDTELQQLEAAGKLWSIKSLFQCWFSLCMQMKIFQSVLTSFR